MNNEIDRLTTYYPFDQEIVETIADVAYEQRYRSWDELRDSLPDARQFTPLDGKPIEVLDIIPAADYDGTLVYHLPFANGLDENMTARVATLAAAAPTKRVIAVGNPGIPGNPSGRLRTKDVSKVWQGDLRPVISPTLEYLEDQGIQDVAHIGYSYGATRALAAAQYAESYDQQVSDAVLMEPVSVTKRNLITLAQAFASSAGMLGHYVEAADSRAYNDARALADERMLGARGYLGMLRLTNIAIAQALTADTLETDIEAALAEQERLHIGIVWGTESELAIDGLIRQITHRLETKHGSERVSSIAVKGQRHAMSEDIFLHAALALQSLQ